MKKTFLIGLDEAGRGSVAGPIVAAAVLCKGLNSEKRILSQVKDSKLLSAKQREELFDLITNNFTWAVHLFNNRYIDRYGIQAANVRVIERAFKKIEDNNTLALSDYVGGAHRYLNKKTIINFYKRGESKFAEIAAASIIAKVYRDRLMNKFCQKYPQYYFSQHKGYGTKQHLEIIKSIGTCPIHRQSFLNRYV